MTGCRQEEEISTETELKLATRPEHLPALRQLIEARAGSPSEETRLIATYFDTPDGVLAWQNLTLRVREEAGRFIQTVKSGDGSKGAALVRGEWEDPVPGGWPDPAAPQTGRFIPSPDQLVGLVRTEITRRTVILCPNPATRIEAAIDLGRVAALHHNACEPVCEIELELKGGSMTLLYDLALEMLAVAPMRLEHCNKSARGFRLAALSTKPETVAPVHASEVALEPGMTAGAALRRIARSCTEQIVQNEPAVLAGLPDGIHQMRVGVRRLRAILSAFAPLLPENEYHWFSDELRWLGGVLGLARNLDVFADSLVAPAIKCIGDTPGAAALNNAVAEQRAAAYAGAVEAIGSPRYTALVLRLMRCSEDSGGDGSWSPALLRSLDDVAPEILNRRLKIVRRRSVRFSRQSPKKRHRLRIALKKLRYALEILGQLYNPKKTGRLLRAAKRLQEELGAANDLSVSRDLVAELARSGAAVAIAKAGDTVLDWHAQRLKSGERKTKKQVTKIRDYVSFR
jgi:inorganic triphosphatase YgiF